LSKVILLYLFRSSTKTRGRWTWLGGGPWRWSDIVRTESSPSTVIRHPQAKSVPKQKSNMFSNNQLQPEVCNRIHSNAIAAALNPPIINWPDSQTVSEFAEEDSSQWSVRTKSDTPLHLPCKLPSCFRGRPRRSQFFYSLQ